jgi:hypothetical protein
VIEYADDGVTVTHEAYWRDGKKHRAGDQPAAIGYAANGATSTYEEYYCEGKLHRGGGQPAVLLVILGIYSAGSASTHTIEQHWHRGEHKTKEEATKRWAPHEHASVSAEGAAVFSAFVHGLRHRDGATCRFEVTAGMH